MENLIVVIVLFYFIFFFFFLGGEGGVDLEEHVQNIVSSFNTGMLKKKTKKPNAFWL